MYQIKRLLRHFSGLTLRYILIHRFKCSDDLDASQTIALDEHNKFRKRHINTPPLCYSKGEAMKNVLFKSAMACSNNL